MSLHPIIREDVATILHQDLPWSDLFGRRVLIAGASGFLPAYLVETLLGLNDLSRGPAVEVVGLVRNAEKARDRFAHHAQRRDFRLLVHDVCHPIDWQGPVDYIVHAASQASPRFYKSDPVGTLSANVLGTHNLLSLARDRGARGFLFFSGGEIYGQVGASQLPTSERDYAVVDPLEVRSCYAESKRLGETMCVCWRHQFGVPAKIARIFHTYGPGMRLDDGRVYADFVADVLARRPIAMKSDGRATRAFCYLADATAGFFTVLLKGDSGEAYNVGNDQGECSIKDLAKLLVALFPERGLSVVEQTRPATDNYVVSKIERGCPNIAKLRALGWSPATALADGFRRTVRSFPVRLAELEKAYASGALGKQEYIGEMYRLHSLLNEYPAFLRGTDISRIEITEQGVIMTFRRSGIRMFCPPRDKRVAPIETLNFGQYEEDELKLILKVIRPGATVLDIGANIGWYALNIARAVPGVRVFAFEPIPETFAHMRANIEVNGISNIEPQNIGLSDKAGQIVFYFCDDSSGSASAANIGERRDAREVPCQVATLDEFVDGRQLKVDFIKCDVEGAELLVFRGAGRCLASQKPVILVEMLRKWSAKFDYHPNEIISLLENVGYHCYQIQREKLSLLPQMDEQTAATNFIFLHSQEHEHFIDALAIDGSRQSGRAR